MRRTLWIYALPVLLLIALTLPHLEQGDYRAETAHYGAIGVQAWRNPALFWTLHEHPSVPYFNKPPLVFWIHGWVLHGFGISLTAARLPSILAAAGCIVFTVGIARRWFGRATALASGVILALTYEYFRRTREISLDLWQLMFMMAAVWIWVRTSHSTRHRTGVAAGLALGFALLCKPLTALLVPCILLLWLAADSSERSFRDRSVRLVWFLLAALLVALPWHLAMACLHGETFTRQYFGQEVGARLQGLRNREPVWYYAVEIGRTYWPWMYLFFIGLARWRRGPVSRHHRTALMSALIWIVVWAAVLSLFPDKRPRYALPIYPMLAILSAYGLASLPWGLLRRWYRRKLPATALAIILAGVVANCLPLRLQAPPDPDLSALVDWVRRQRPDAVYSAAMTASDESMLYLKTGHWPIPLRANPHPEPGSLFIHTASLPPEPGFNDACVFRQGRYRVTRK